MGSGLAPSIADAMLVTRKLLVVKRSSSWPAASQRKAWEAPEKALAQHLLSVLCSLQRQPSTPSPVPHPPATAFSKLFFSTPDTPLPSHPHHHPRSAGCEVTTMQGLENIVEN